MSNGSFLKKFLTRSIGRILFVSLYVLIIFVACSCKKTDTGTGIISTPPPPPPPSTPVVTILNDASSSPVGVDINSNLYKGNSSYSTVVKTQFDRITAEYQMKHG